VLKGETLASKLAYFRSNGTLGDYPRVNPKAFKDWMKKLESTKDNAPLEWIRNMILDKPVARLTPQQLMSRILTCDDERDYYGLCCDGKEESDVSAELRDVEFEDCSNSEGSTAPYPCTVWPADTFSKQSCPMMKRLQRKPQIRLF
jgi:hypothetical protein